MDLSVIIVNYNTYEYTKNCIESVLNADDDLNGERLEFEVILVDNASKDGSIEWIEKEYNDEPKVLIIKNDENLGFSALRGEPLNPMFSLSLGRSTACAYAYPLDTMENK